MRVREPSAHLLPLVVILLCGPACAPAATAERGASVTSSPMALPKGAGPRVSVEWVGAPRVRYSPSVVGGTRPQLRVVITNPSADELDVSNLRVALSVVRDGVPMACPDAGHLERREQQTVAPGRTATFERTLDCPLPLVGNYDVNVAVAFGAGEHARPKPVRTMSLKVVSSPDVQPRALVSVPGLWANIGASNVAGRVASDAKGSLVVSIVNGTTHDVEVPPMQLALRVFRGENPFPCEDEPTRLQAPARLAAGHSYVESMPVSCVGLRDAGSYRVIGRLFVEVPGQTKPREEEIGKLFVEVSTNPTLVNP